jgi:hypothetical protein
MIERPAASMTLLHRQGGTQHLKNNLRCDNYLWMVVSEIAPFPLLPRFRLRIAKCCTLAEFHYPKLCHFKTFLVGRIKGMMLQCDRFQYNQQFSHATITKP